MAQFEPEELVKIAEIENARSLVTNAGDNVRQLKAAKATEAEVSAALDALNAARTNLDTLSKAFYPPSKLDLDRDGLESLLVRRFFFCPSFSIYGGVKGFYDFGPPGCAVKANMIAFWRQFFIVEESMLEVDTATVTPSVVFVNSGHVERFNDLMVKDMNTGKYYRADHLLEEAMENLMNTKGISELKKQEYKTVQNNADQYTFEELTAKLREYELKSPEGNPISDAFPSNLMFSTNVGRGEGGLSYLRPETAQGIFVNFARLLEYNGGRIPFSAATIGMAYRNEISPRAGLLRVREFTLAEIEHFVDADDKSHPKFDSVRHIRVRFLSRERQSLPVHIPLERTIGEALESGMIQNETMGYFIARVHLFMTSIGIKGEYLRFRQHREKEMAHYAQDCWDAETLTSYGWIECVGIADRSCYDLTKHTEGSTTKLTAFKRYDTPKEVKQLVVIPNRPVIGKNLRQKAKVLLTYLESLDETNISKLQTELAQNKSTSVTLDGETFQVTEEMISFKEETKTVNGENYIPSVIEPSFGIGRILYSLLEHSYYARESDKNRTVVALSPLIAPVKCSVLPLLQNAEFVPFVKQVSSLLVAAGISTKVDDAGQTVGKRYARTDEIGIPFGVTIDHQTLEDQTVTLRERDSTAQIRIPISEVANFILQIVNNQSTWAESHTQYPVVGN